MVGVRVASKRQENCGFCNTKGKCKLLLFVNSAVILVSYFRKTEINVLNRVSINSRKFNYYNSVNFFLIFLFLPHPKYFTLENRLIYITRA